MHKQVSIPDGDVLVHCGDFTWKGRPQEIQSFNDWLGTLPFKKSNILVCAGNHDMMLEDDPERAEAMLTNCTYLKDSGTTIDGISFYGSPWQPVFHNWAFNLERGSEEMKAVWAKIPTGVDVLITHAPPNGVMDLCSDHLDRTKLVNVGCKILRDEVFNRVKPKVHCFGHIHSGYGQLSNDQTTFINASILNDNYTIANKAICIEVKNT